MMSDKKKQFKVKKNEDKEESEFLLCIMRYAALEANGCLEGAR